MSDAPVSRYRPRGYYKKPYKMDYKEKAYARKKRQKKRYTKAQEAAHKDMTTGIVESARDIGSGIGGFFGGPLGGTLGGAAGSLIGRGISYFTGKGDYKVVKNALLYPVKGPLVPVRNPDTGDGVMIRRSEYITDVISSGTANTFKIDAYDINPGLENTFQWLSQVASEFDEWVCEGMYFEFRSMSADALNSTNTALGSVILSCNYNSAQPNFTNKQSMENYEGGVSVRPSESVRYFVECAKAQTVLNELYVRNGDVPSGQDQRFYDLGTFQIATAGMQGTNVNVGELWVSYQMRLRKPKMFSTLGLYHWFYEAIITSASSAAPLGTAWTATVAAANNLPSVRTTGVVMTFPYTSVPQAFFVILNYIGGSVAISAPTVTGGTGLTVTNRIQVPNNAETSTRFCLAFSVYVPGNNLAANNTVTLGAAGTLPSAISSAQVWIMQMPNTFGGI